MALAGAIAVYGATGYTGRLVAREGARRGLPIVLSGRDAGRPVRLPIRQHHLFLPLSGPGAERALPLSGPGR